jgi:hypothetical protein
MSLLQSCKNEPSWTPVFLTVAQGHALKTMVDLIIPHDEQMPGAVSLGVHQFIDAYWNNVLADSATGLEDEYTKLRTTQKKQFIKDAFANLEVSFQNSYEKGLGKGTNEEYDELLASYLRAPKEEQDKLQEDLAEYSNLVDEDPSVTLASEAQNYFLLSTIRDLSFWAWKNSEEIGENVLWYDPVPGQYQGCIPLSEAGNGKAMSL